MAIGRTELNQSLGKEEVEQMKKCVYFGQKRRKSIEAFDADEEHNRVVRIDSRLRYVEATNKA